MFARAAVFIALLPAIAVSDVPPPLAPGWLPETAVIEIPAEAPITVTFLAELQKPDPVYADYDTALQAARSGDGEAAYTLYRQAMWCDMFKLRQQAQGATTRASSDVNPELLRYAGFCKTMPPDARHLRHHWLRDSVEAGYPAAILQWGMSGAREEDRARLEQLWYRGDLRALAALAGGERRWTRLSPEPARTLLVRSMGYEWLYAKISEEAYRGAPEHHRVLARLTLNFEQRWSSLNEDEKRAALRLAHSLLLESKECCTVPASGPQLQLGI